MAKYVLRHGSISYGRDGLVVPAVQGKPPTTIELEAEEAAKLNGNWNGQLLPGVVDQGPMLQLLSEHEAEQAGEKAKAEAITKVKGEKAKAEAITKGGKS